MAAVVLACAACGGTASSPQLGGEGGSSAPTSARPTPLTTTPSPLATPVVPTALPTASAHATQAPDEAVTGLAGRWVELARQAQEDDPTVDRLLPLQAGGVLVLGSWLGSSRSPSLVLDPTAGTWTTVYVEVGEDDVAVARSDGQLFVAGTTEPRVWSQDAGHWSFVGSNVMSRHERAPSVAALADGRILVAGGCRSARDPSGASRWEALTSTDVFDLEPGWEWDAATGAGDLAHPRIGAPAATLEDGRVLVAGSLSELSSWEAGDERTCGPDPSGRAAWTAEAWDPATGRFTPTGDLPEVDRAAVASTGVMLPAARPDVVDPGRLVALLDGGALLLGRRETWPDSSTVTRSLRYDAAYDRWAEIGRGYVRDGSTGTGIGTDRRDAAVVRLADGRVLVAGGIAFGSSPYGLDGTRWADLYDPATGGWSPLPTLPEAFSSLASVAFADGSAIVVGATGPSWRSEASPELVAVGFLPAGAAPSAQAPGAGGGPNSAATPNPSAAPGAACPESVSPSSLAGMERERRVGCFGGRDLVFDADVVVSAGTIVDRVAFALPAVFRPVKRPSPDWPDPAVTWPVYLVDAGVAQAAPGAALDLRVADPSVIPADLPARMRARVTGHVDDPAAIACRPPPAGFIGGDMTEQQAVLMCRAAFVVTRIEPLQ